MTNRIIRPNLYIVTVFVVILMAVSCTPQIVIDVQNDVEKLNIKFSTNLTSTAESAVASMTGSATNESLFSAPEITRALCDAGFSKVAVKETGRSGFEVSCSQPTVTRDYNGEQNNRAVIPSRIIRDGNVSELQLHITAVEIRSLIAALPADLSGYTELLMAPVLTAEILSPTEFIELIATAYGETLAEELENSVFTVTVSVPGIVESGDASFLHGVFPAVVSGKKAIYLIPTAVLFTETDSARLSVRWH